MKKCSKLYSVMLACCTALIPLAAGCSQKEASEAISEAKASAEEASQSLAGDASAMMEKGKEMASELGENATAFLTPLKEKFGNLESLKETPEKLKTAVTELITSIEQKADGINLPEAMRQTLASVKEKLVALKNYLEGEYEQAGIDEKVNDIVSSVKSGLGMSSN